MQQQAPFLTGQPQQYAAYAPGQQPAMAMGAGPYPGQWAGVVQIPMQEGLCVHRYFDPVYSATLPMDWAELSRAVDEINITVARAMPRWARVLPFAMVPLGFVMFALGGFLMVATSSFNGPSPAAIAVLLAGFFLFGAGGFGSVCCAGCMASRVLSDLRCKISELNARYAHQGVDFQLHETPHLMLYHNHSANGHCHVGVRSVNRYTLVIQAVGSDGQGPVPPPGVLAQQALRLAPAGRGFAPSAPMQV